MFFINELINLDRKQKNRVATIIEGEHQGKKAIYVGERLYNSEEDVAVFTSLPREVVASDKPTIAMMNGERVFVESIKSDPHMIICGGGHVSIAVIKMAKMLEFSVTVLEDRPFFAERAKAAGADYVICDQFEKGLETIEGNENTYFVIVTRGHRYDIECLRSILKKNHAYIGMIGSKKRVKSVKDLMISDGFDKNLVDSMYSPIGMKIGAETPAEIAVAIMAEIIQVKNQEKGSSGFTTEIIEYLEKEWKKTKLPLAIVTIISRKGAAPRGIGTKMLVMRTGQMIGTIGGGCAEADIQHQAIQCMEQGISKLVQVDMTGKDAEEDGMVCGGMIEVFIDCFQLF